MPSSLPLPANVVPPLQLVEALSSSAALVRLMSSLTSTVYVQRYPNLGAAQVGKANLSLGVSYPCLPAPISTQLGMGALGILANCPTYATGPRLSPGSRPVPPCGCHPLA